MSLKFDKMLVLNNFMIVKLLLTYRVENILQMVIEDPKMEKLFYNITSGKYKKKLL